MGNAMHSVRCLALSIVVAVNTLSSNFAFAITHSDAEAWAWNQIKERRAADFNERCQSTDLPPGTIDSFRWDDDCRRIRGAFIVDLVNETTNAEKIPNTGIQIFGAQIDGDVDFTNIRLSRDIDIEASRLAKNLILNSSRSSNDVSFVRTDVSGMVDADGFRTEMSLYLTESTFEDRVSLSYSKVDGHIDMIGATFQNTLDMDSLQVGSHVLLRRSRTFGDIVLVSSKVVGNIDLEGAICGGTVNGDYLQTGGSLFLRATDADRAAFSSVLVRGAKVSGDADFAGSTIHRLDAESLHVGDNIFMFSMDSRPAIYGFVSLIRANVGGSINLENAMFTSQFWAERLQVGSDVFVRGVSPLRSDEEREPDRKSEGLRINLLFSRISGSLDLRGATLGELDLSGATIGGDLRFGGGQDGLPTIWMAGDQGPGHLILRNTQTVNLMDAKDAWPPRGYLSVDGFGFAHLGGYAGDTAPEMRGRGMRWWDQWIRRDMTYNPALYEQLATAFIRNGDRGAADEIRYLGRVHQREREPNWWPWLFTGFLQYVAGFGIGDYTFRVIYWVVGISVLGGLYLWRLVPAGRVRGLWWCVGATLSKLLPIIEINKEYSDFFNDPHRKRLSNAETAVFSGIGMLGWLFGGLLIAAMSGLTQKL